MIAVGYGIAGELQDFFVYDEAGNVWNGADYVTWTDADYADYRVVAVQVGSSNRFIATLPIDAASYDLRLREATLDDSVVLYTGEPQPAVAADGSVKAALALIGGITLPSLTVVSGSTGVITVAGHPFDVGGAEDAIAVVEIGTGIHFCKIRRMAQNGANTDIFFAGSWAAFDYSTATAISVVPSQSTAGTRGAAI